MLLGNAQVEPSEAAIATAGNDDLDSERPRKNAGLASSMHQTLKQLLAAGEMIRQRG